MTKKTRGLRDLKNCAILATILLRTTAQSAAESAARYGTLVELEAEREAAECELFTHVLLAGASLKELCDAAFAGELHTLPKVTWNPEWHDQAPPR